MMFQLVLTIVVLIFFLRDSCMIVSNDTYVTCNFHRTKTDANSAVDKSDFVSEWCNDTIKQFLDGKPLASIQPTNVTDRAVSG